MLFESVRSAVTAFRSHGWPDEEGRAAERYTCSPRTLCHLVGRAPGDPWPIRVQNLSNDGIALVCSRPFPIGNLLTIQLCNADRGFSRSLRLRVVHACRHPSGDWLVGAAFQRSLSAPEVAALADPEAAPPDLRLQVQQSRSSM